MLCFGQCGFYKLLPLDLLLDKPSPLYTPMMAEQSLSAFSLQVSRNLAISEEEMLARQLMSVQPITTSECNFILILEPDHCTKISQRHYGPCRVITCGPGNKFIIRILDSGDECIAHVASLITYSY